MAADVQSAVFHSVPSGRQQAVSLHAALRAAQPLQRGAAGPLKFACLQSIGTCQTEFTAWAVLPDWCISGKQDVQEADRSAKHEHKQRRQLSVTWAYLHVHGYLASPSPGVSDQTFTREQALASACLSVMGYHKSILGPLISCLMPT